MVLYFFFFIAAELRTRYDGLTEYLSSCHRAVYYNFSIFNADISICDFDY